VEERSGVLCGKIAVEQTRNEEDQTKDEATAEEEEDEEERGWGP